MTTKIKRALCIGINYLATPESRLYGCIRDAIEMTEFLQDSLGYKNENIVVLRDDMTDSMPTAARIVSELGRLQTMSINCEEIVIHYSGHGSQIRDNTGDETDGKDECLIPSDYNKSGIISDDMLGMILGGMRCRVIVIMDCCHSATCVDLPYLFYYEPSATSIQRQVIQSRVGFPSNVVMISGCKDSQTSADAYFKQNSSSMGVLTNAILNVQRKLSQKDEYMQRYIPLSTFYTEVYKYIKEQGFTQDICLSTSMNVEVPALEHMSFFYSPPIVLTVQPIASETSSTSTPSYIMSADASDNRPTSYGPMATVTIPVPLNSTSTYTISIHEHNRIIDELKKTITDMSCQIVSLTGQLTSANTLATQLQKQYDSLNSQYATLQSDHSASKKQYDTLKSQLDAILNSEEYKRSVNYKSEIDNLRKEIAGLQGQKTTLERQVNIYKPYMTKSSELQNEILKQQDLYRAQIAQFQANVTTLQKTLENIKETHKKEQQELATKLAEAATKLSALQKLNASTPTPSVTQPASNSSGPVPVTPTPTPVTTIPMQPVTTTSATSTTTLPTTSTTTAQSTATTTSPTTTPTPVTTTTTTSSTTTPTSPVSTPVTANETPTDRRNRLRAALRRR
jgi:chaperonin cofactor prefoldin